MNSIKEMVKDGKKAYFKFYRKGELFYETECGFEFPVDIKDAGDGIFLSEHKAITLMRYIRIHMKSIEAGKSESLC